MAMKHPLRDLARQLRSNMTDAERFVWRRIRKKQFAGHRFRRQHPIGEHIVDFVCLEAKLILELDGGQHAERKEEDEQRTRCLEALGFRVARFWNIDIFKEWDAVEAVILRELVGESICPPPCPPPEAGGGEKGAER
jgi:very-short-patch-repair endonuclease